MKPQKHTGKKGGNVICDACARPILQCPWFCDGKPVPGWDATPVRKWIGHGKGGDVYADTYQIHACPLRMVPGTAGQKKNGKRTALGR